MKKILSILMALVLTITLSAQKTQYYDLIIQKTTPLLHLYGSGATINMNNGAVTITGAADSLIVAGGGITLTHNNSIKLSGDATVFEDLRFPFSTGHQGFNTYPPFNTDSLYFTFTVDSAGNDAQFMYFIIQFPHSWKTGSVIKPHIHYKQQAPSGATPVYLFKYKWYPLGGSTRKGWSWYTMNTATDTIRYTHQLLYGASGITPPAAVTGVSSEIVGMVYLKSLAAGTTASNSWEFDIHYEIDALGSRTETAK